MLFCTANIYSQNFNITGRVIDATNNNPLEYATIVLTSMDGSETIGGITDKKGNFKISIPQNSYTISIEYLAYLPKTMSIDSISSNTHIGTIKLLINVEALNEVSINSNKNATEIKLDKKIYNVEKDILSNGGTAIDVITNAPSVSVSADGLPTIRGSAAKIMINGRLSSKSKLEELKNLPASSIQKIEVITVPSARYSGDSNGGIINIILKKGLDKGFNGSITGTVSLDENQIYGIATSLNYGTNKLNIYTNTNLYHRAPIANTLIKNKYLSNGNTYGYLDEDRVYTRENVVFESVLGLDYYFNDYASLNIEGSYANHNGDFRNKNRSEFFDANKNLTSIEERNIFTNHKNNIYKISATYLQYFERENELIYIEFSHNKDIETNDNFLNNRDFFPIYSENPDQNEFIYDDLDIQNTQWFLAYDMPISETVFFEFGYESTLGKAKNNFLNEIIENGNLVPNPLTSNIFHYTENWHRVYTMYNHTFGNFSYRIGLSTEFTNLDVNLITTNQRSQQNYTTFNPSASFKYILSDTKSISLKYSKGMKRANYPNLNPFEKYISETTSFKGNENLLPFYINNFELSFLTQNEDSKFVLNPSLYFKNYNDYWQYVTYETGDIVNGVPKLITTPFNLGNLNFGGIELVSTYTPNDWVNFSSTIDMFYAIQNGVFEYTDSNNDLVILDYENTNFSGFVKLNTTFNLKNNFKIQGLIEYHLSSIAAYSKRDDYAFANLSASKDLFNNQATLSFIAKDIFNSNRIMRTRYPNDNVISYADTQWNQQTFLLSLTWRFNQSKKRKQEGTEMDLDIKFDSKDTKVNN